MLTVVQVQKILNNYIIKLRWEGSRCLLQEICEEVGGIFFSLIKQICKNDSFNSYKTH